VIAALAGRNAAAIPLGVGSCKDIPPNEEMSKSDAGVMLVMKRMTNLVGVVFYNRGVARRTGHSLLYMSKLIAV
jgi:hypothetical protein